VAEIKDADVTLPISLKEMARGSIRVTSDPSGASVLMDSKKIGITPLDLADIGPGQKKITVEQNGYKPVMQTASVKSGQQTQLDVRLEAMICVIKITSDPSNADVYVDDQKSGTTPVELKNISAGSHKIVINKDGYLNFTQT
jgi:PEGA domain